MDIAREELSKSPKEVSSEKLQVLIRYNFFLKAHKHFIDHVYERSR